MVQAAHVLVCSLEEVSGIVFTYVTQPPRGPWEVWPRSMLDVGPRVGITSGSSSEQTIVERRGGAV